MTQALINNLQILSDKQFNLTDKMSKNTGMDFGKIFETKTGEISKNAVNIYHNEDNNRMQNPAKDTYKKPEQSGFEKIHNQNKTVKNNNSNIKNNNDDNKQITIEPAEQDKVQSETDNKENMLLKGFVEEITEDETKLAEEIITVAESIPVINENDEEETITDITEETENTDETTITEEDSTMYKELTTLENPTAFLMLQSQLSKTVKQALQEEQTDIAEQSVSQRASTQTQNNNDSAETAVFKQFDASFVKDAVLTANASKKAVNTKPDGDKLSGLINRNMVKEMNVEIVASQSAEAEGSMSDLMQNQSPQEQTARIMIQGDVKYEAVAAEAAKGAAQTKTVNVNINPSKIIDQITKQLDGMFNNSKINLVLNPGSLGKLNLQLMNTKDGLIAQFTATTQEARDILMKGLDGLKESLLAQGVNVDNVSVKLEEAEGEYKQDYTEQEGSKGGNKHQGTKKQKENGKNFEEMMFELEQNGNV